MTDPRRNQHAQHLPSPGLVHLVQGEPRVRGGAVEIEPSRVSYRIHQLSRFPFGRSVSLKPVCHRAHSTKPNRRVRWILVLQDHRGPSSRFPRGSPLRRACGENTAGWSSPAHAHRRGPEVRQHPARQHPGHGAGAPPSGLLCPANVSRQSRVTENARTTFRVSHNDDALPPSVRLPSPP